MNVHQIDIEVREGVCMKLRVRELSNELVELDTVMEIEYNLMDFEDTEFERRTPRHTGQVYLQATLLLTMKLDRRTLRCELTYRGERVGHKSTEYPV
jgi:hypothetical protein